MNHSAVSIAIVDDQRIMRDTIVKKLLPFAEVKVCFIADSANALFEWLKKNQVELVLMDVKMPIMDGIEATRRLKIEFPAIKVLMLSVFDDDTSVFEAIKAGAEGYLLKDIDGNKLRNGIFDTINGGAAITPSIALKIVKYFEQATIKIPQNVNYTSLTNREREVLSYLCRGMTYRLIADNLFISPNTVRRHIENIYSKLNACSRFEAVEIARQKQLIPFK